MQYRKPTVLAALALGILLPLGSVAMATETKEPAATPAAKATPPAPDLAKLEADVGLTPEQKTEVNALLAKLKASRRAVKEDASLSPEDKKKKTAAVSQEIYSKIKALMTPEQYVKWEKLQEAIRASRSK